MSPTDTDGIGVLDIISCNKYSLRHEIIALRGSGIVVKKESLLACFCQLVPQNEDRILHVGTGLAMVGRDFFEVMPWNRCREPVSLRIEPVISVLGIWIVDLAHGYRQILVLDDAFIVFLALLFDALVQDDAQHSQHENRTHHNDSE